MLPQRVTQPVKSFVQTYNPMRFATRNLAPAVHTPRVDVHLVRGQYTVKVATTRDELAAVFRLRQHVFQREFKNKIFSLQSDREIYDEHADFLIITDNTLNKVVGTYRLISTQHSQVLYSASEFDLSGFLATPEAKLELSRACIHRKYRTGMVMHLLWRGVAAYVQGLGARYLFGCGSIKTTDTREIVRIYTSLAAAGKVSHEYNIHPIGKYCIQDLPERIADYMCGLDAPSESCEPPELPSLIRSYLKAGAMIHGLPALDMDFKCIDALTILDFSKMSQQHERKYAKQ